MNVQLNIQVGWKGPEQKSSNPDSRNKGVQEVLPILRTNKLFTKSLRQGYSCYPGDNLPPRSSRDFSFDDPSQGQSGPVPTLSLNESKGRGTEQEDFYLPCMKDHGSGPSHESFLIRRRKHRSRLPRSRRTPYQGGLGPHGGSDTQGVSEPSISLPDTL